MKTYIAILTVLVATICTVRAADEFQPATLPYGALCQIAQLDLSDTTGFNRYQS